MTLISNSFFGGCDFLGRPRLPLGAAEYSLFYGGIQGGGLLKFARAGSLFLGSHFITSNIKRTAMVNHHSPQGHASKVIYVITFMLDLVLLLLIWCHLQKWLRAWKFVQFRGFSTFYAAQLVPRVLSINNINALLEDLSISSFHSFCPVETVSGSDYSNDTSQQKQ